MRSLTLTMDIACRWIRLGGKCSFSFWDWQADLVVLRACEAELSGIHISAWPTLPTGHIMCRPTGIFPFLLIWSTLFQLQWL